MENKEQIKEPLKNIAGEIIYEGQSRLTRKPKTNKTYDKEPSYKMRKAFKAVTEGKTMVEAKEIAGYKESRNSTEITQSKSWIKLLNEHVSKEELSTTHNKLLKSKNENIQAKMVDLGYKVHGLYKDDNDNAKGKVLNLTGILNVFTSKEQIEHLN